MAYSVTTKVRISQVDPAGIVFYPRYFEMLNGALEDWFDEALGLDMATMHLVRHMGVPTVKLDVTFLSPSILGEVLTITVIPQKVGRSSCNVRMVFSCAGSERLYADMIIVCMDLAEKRAMPWPAELRERLEAGLQEA